VHGEDALYVANNVYKTTSVLKYLGPEGPRSLPSCTLSRQSCITFIRDVVFNNNFKIEIWQNDSSSRKINWTVVKRASPGNIQDVEQLLFENSDVNVSPVILALKLVPSSNNAITVAVAFADATCGNTFAVSEFLDNETFSNFESLLIQSQVKECIISDDTQAYDMKKII
ncbi:MutS-like protein, partial [Nowakowskiella sp. JEL0078]